MYGALIWTFKSKFIKTDIALQRNKSVSTHIRFEQTCIIASEKVENYICLGEK